MIISVRSILIAMVQDNMGSCGCDVVRKGSATPALLRPLFGHKVHAHLIQLESCGRVKALGFPVKAGRFLKN